MTAATDNRKHEGDGTNLGRDEVATAWNGPIAADAVLYKGTLAGVLLSDTSNPPAIDTFVGDGTMRALGFVTLGADNTGGALGARPIRVIAGTGVLIDKNAGGGSAITIADLLRPIYGADNQTCSKLAADGPYIGILTGIDKATGRPVVLVDPVVNRALPHAAGTTYTQTYSTANRTVANPTATALTDNSGGAAADGTIAAVTLPGALTDNSGGAAADGTIGAINVPAALTDNSGGGAADSTIGAIPNPADTPASADALRDDLVATTIPAVKDAIAELAAKVNAQRTSLVALTDAVAELAAKCNASNTAISALRDAVPELVDRITKLIADDLDNRQSITALIDDLQAATLVN
jgi:hypothetical protein